MIVLVLGALAEEPRPILGIGVGLRGDGDGADFVASARVRTSESFVVEPGLEVQGRWARMDTDYEGEVSSNDSTETVSDVELHPEVVLRGRLGQRGRVSGWLVGRVQGMLGDEHYQGLAWPSDAESGANDERTELTEAYAAVAVGGGFATEVFLSPELAVSADLGATLASGVWTWSGYGFDAPASTTGDLEATESDTDFAQLTVGFFPYAQLAIHLYY